MINLQINRSNFWKFLLCNAFLLEVLISLPDCCKLKSKWDWHTLTSNSSAATP